MKKALIFTLFVISFVITPRGLHQKLPASSAIQPGFQGDSY